MESYIGKLRRLWKKTDVIQMYNKYMGGVDFYDQLMKYSAFSHITCKWWKKVIFRILNLAMINAYTMHSEWIATKGKKELTQTNFTHLEKTFSYSLGTLAPIRTTFSKKNRR